MSLTPTITDERREVMIRYLLGELSGGDQSALELEFFSDSETFDQVWAIENDLVDAYVRNRLPRRQRELFERHYLQSPKHRERVALAGMLLKTADQTAPVTSSEPAVSWWNKLLESLRGPNLILAGAMTTAMLLLAPGASWLLIERNRLNDQLAREQAGRGAQQQREQELSRQIQELEKRIAAERRQNEQANSELTGLRAELRRIQTRQSAPPSSQPALLAFLLIPGGVRAGGEMQQLVIPPDVSQTQLRLKAETSDYRNFQFRLRAVDGGEILSRSNLRSRSPSFVTVTLPARILAAGDYILTLSGVNASGVLEEINSYFFRVTRQ
jgi:hypothetical protein